MRGKPHTVHKNVLKSEVGRKYIFFSLTNTISLLPNERRILRLANICGEVIYHRRIRIALFFFNPLPVKGGGGGVLFPYINTPPVISTINWHSLSPNILWSCLFSKDKDLIMRRIRIYFPARHFEL